MRAGRPIAVLSVVLLLSACSQEVRGVASAGSPGAPPSPSSSPPTPPPGQADDAGADTEAKSGPATEEADDGAQVTGINVRSDGSSARLAVSLSGSGVPDWEVEYSDATGPDGAPVDIAGDAFLRVRVRSDAAGDRGSSRFSISPGPVAEARTTGTSGGYAEVLIGVRGREQPFSVEAATDPGRLVIEVRSAG